MTDDPSAAAQLAAINAALTAAPPDVNSVLEIATSMLSRIRPATWVAVVMNPDPATSRVVVADDTELAMAEYVEAYVTAIDRPHRAPTTGMSQQVIESDVPILRPTVTYDDFLSSVSAQGREFMRTNPPPFGRDHFGVLVVPMRVGGARIGSLSAFDWKQERLFDESDLDWVQPVADRIALSVEHARLAGRAEQNAVRLEVIRAIGLAVRQRQDVGLIARVVVEQVISRLGVDAADILLLSDGATDLVLTAAAGFRSPVALGYRTPVGSMPVTGTSWQPLAQSLTDGERKAHNPRAPHFAREGFQTMLTVPLHARNRLAGVLELYQRAPFEWEQDSLEFFDTLGGLIGVAIDHASAPTPDAARERRSPRPALSDLELQILRLIVEGFTNRDIAEQVHRSENTIKFHVRRILDKTKTANRTELARHATRDGWL